ncbi:hypothetical protein [Hymenobacter metallilatus]|uniref:Uncharacterized protein n=1 Tax=Hymenobacter metallilatus TaxID=2493666 RepID=A0A3R9NTM6_9BACT|nr:hypothetical protein [Hymenobacter metallilatus]RSK37359.1 hypothetical protein EI290_01520 [Hymenobacter metallilatus]
MKRFLFAAAIAAAFLSAPQAQAQTIKKAAPQKAANSSVAPVTRPAEDDWGWDNDVPAEPVSGWDVPGAETPAVATSSADPMMQSSGVLVAPGMSSSPYRGTSTDYHGRPVAKVKSKRPRSVDVAQNDPMMQSSGVMLAPGMNTAPYRAVSTDYHGRPLRKASSAGVVAAQPTPENTTVAAGW